MSIFISAAALLLITLLFYRVLAKEEKDRIEFFHIMAHRFRSPISIIKWYIELLSNKSAGNLTDKQKEYFTEIYKASEKLNENIESLIILIQLQSNKLTFEKEKTDIKTLICKAIEKQESKANRHKLHLQSTLPQNKELTAEIDPKLLNIILENLIENSIKYTPENGYIDIRGDIVSNKLLLEVKDTGYGIPKVRKSRMLANSVTSKDMDFSMHLVKLILKKMKAKTNHYFEENKGTTFSISLPL